MTHLRSVRLEAAMSLTPDIRLLRLVPADGRPPESAKAGAHVDLHLPGGLVRPYSLILDGHETREQYEIAVKKETNGRGGSRTVHDVLEPGAILQLGEPRNTFPLVEDAAHSVLIAGGIGITPLWSMMRRLEVLRRPFELHYACRSRSDVVYHDALQRRPGVTLHIDDEVGKVLDVAAICRAAPGDSHFYCCGPAPMIAAFERATAACARDCVHVERFAADPMPSVDARDFGLELARSGRVLKVRAGERIVDVLREAGIDVNVSCEQGVCGACETRVLAGTPEHRCQVLSDEERALNQTMMVCCGGSREARLVLDL